MTRRKSTRCGGAGANPGTQPGDQIGAQGQPLVQQRTAAAAATATRPPQQGVVGLGSQQPSGRRPLPLLGMAARKSAPPNYVYSGSSSEEEEEEEEEQAPAPSRLPLLGMAARKSAPPNYVDSGSSSEEEEEVEDAPAPSRLPLLGMAARKSAPPNYVDSGSSSEEEEAAAAPRPPLQGAVQLGGQQPGRMAARKMGELAVHSSQGAARRNNRRRRQRAAASSDAATPPASAAGAAAGASGAAARLNLRDTMSLLQMLTYLDCLEETGAPRCFDTPAALMQHAVAKHGENSCGFMWRICEVCSRNFSSPHWRNKHVVEAHMPHGFQAAAAAGAPNRQRNAGSDAASSDGDEEPAKLPPGERFAPDSKHADILDMLTCYACNFEGGPDFQSPAGLLQHLHAKGCCAEQAAWVEALRRCPDCGRLFGSFQALSSHVTGKHLSELEALDEAEEQLWLEDWSSEEGSQGCARYGGMGIALGGSAEELEQRMSNCGFTDAEAFELLCQGVKPWDDDAWAVMHALNDYDDDDYY